MSMASRRWGQVEAGNLDLAGATSRLRTSRAASILFRPLPPSPPFFIQPPFTFLDHSRDWARFEFSTKLIVYNSSQIIGKIDHCSVKICTSVQLAGREGLGQSVTYSYSSSCHFLPTSINSKMSQKTLFMYWVQRVTRFSMKCFENICSKWISWITS